MSLIPDNFQFSQSSLQNFSSCPRRFRLKYLDQLRWPAVEAEPIREAERLARLGHDFHRLVHQHVIGIEAETLSAYLQTADPELQLWWQNYLDHRPNWLDSAQLYPELSLSTPLRGNRLLARFDLLAVRPDGTLVIIDWKTSQRKPSREDLARRIQTRVYPYVLVMAGQAFNSRQPIDPAQVEMVFWYTQFPDEPIKFVYSQSFFQRDESYLNNLLDQVNHSDFPLVKDDEPCAWCVYRSFCGRGESPGNLDDESLETEPKDELDDLSLDWEQIVEIQF